MAKPAPRVGAEAHPSNDTEPESEARIPTASQSSWNTTPGADTRHEGEAELLAPASSASTVTAVLRIVAEGAIVGETLRPSTTHRSPSRRAVVRGRVKSAAADSLTAEAKTTSSATIGTQQPGGGRRLARMLRWIAADDIVVASAVSEPSPQNLTRRDDGATRCRGGSSRDARPS